MRDLVDRDIRTFSRQFDGDRPVDAPRRSGDDTPPAPPVQNLRAESVALALVQGGSLAAPTAYTFGNSARNLLYGPGQKIIHVSLAKSTAMTESLKTEFRADFFNLPNTPVSRSGLWQTRRAGGNSDTDSNGL